MSASLITQDARMKTFAVMVPASLLLVYMATQMAAEEYLATIGAASLFSVLVFFTVFVKTVRPEAAIIGMLLIGYLIGNRGFAQLALVRPIFVGEMGLGAIVLAMGFRFLLSRETPAMDQWLPRLILIFLALGGLHFLFNFRTYGVDAVRDFAIVYYTLFFFAAERLGRQQISRDFIERCLFVGFLGLAVISLIVRVSPEFLSSIEIAGVPVFAQKDDLTATFAAVGVFFFYLRPPPLGRQWIRVIMILLFLVFVINGVTRSALLGLIVASMLCLLANKKGFFLYPVVAAVAGLTVFAGYSAALSTERSSEWDAMQEKLVSMVDVTGNANYNTEVGQMKADNNEFRRVFWQSVVDETNMQNPIFGLGFGYDFYPRFQQLYNRGVWDGLRSPHNYFVTIYGRMGITGLIVLLILSVKIFYDAVRAARDVRFERLESKTLFYWCGVVIILVSAGLGVVLEGPMGAIIFWSLLGFAFAASRKEAAPPAESVFARGMPLAGALRPAGSEPRFAEHR